jgi:hypothetical protein
MANTYGLIEAKTLSATAASVTFSSIPQTFTDLVLSISPRSTVSSTIAGIDITLSGSTTNIYRYTRIYGEGSGGTVTRSYSSAGQPMTVNWINGGTSNANTFSNCELYIPNYTGTAAKPMSWKAIQENNNATAYITQHALFANLTSAVTSILLADNSGGVFDVGTTFYLYGISNA